MYECFHCLSRSVVWDNDYTFEDFGMEGEGFVHCCHCANCGADIVYFINCDEDEDGDSKKEL